MATARTGFLRLCLRRILIALALISFFAVAGCSREEGAYKTASSSDSIESWRGFLEKYPESTHAQEARERISQLEEIIAARTAIEGKDAIAKTKAILRLQKMAKDALPIELASALIAALSDETSVQIPENIAGAEVSLNTRFGAGSELRMGEGSIFPSDTGMVIAGKNAVLRVSTPADEARAVLAKMAGEDLGPDAARWAQWLAQHQKESAGR